MKPGDKFEMKIEFEVISMTKDGSLVFQMRGELSKSYLKYYNFMTRKEFNKFLKSKLIKMKKT